MNNQNNNPKMQLNVFDGHLGLPSIDVLSLQMMVIHFYHLVNVLNLTYSQFI